MIARLIVFLASAAYLAFTGSWVLAVFALAGLIPGILGLIGAVAFAVVLLFTGHYILGALVVIRVAFVFYQNNTQANNAARTQLQEYLDSDRMSPLVVLHRREEMAGKVEKSPYGWCRYDPRTSGFPRTAEGAIAAHRVLEESGYAARIVPREYVDEHGFPKTKEAENYRLDAETPLNGALSEPGLNFWNGGQEESTDFPPEPG